MLKLFKKKTPVYIDLENYDYSSFARDMTEEELLTVNGGRQIANTNEAVANAKPGDTLTRSDNTTVVITESDIKWAQEQVGSPSTTSNTTSTESTSSTSNTSSESTSDRPKDQNNASSTGGSRVNMGAGSMTVSDYIAQQRKKGAGATPAGQAVEVRKNEGQAAEGNSTAEVVDPRNRGFTLTTDNYPDAYGTGKMEHNEKKKEGLTKIKDSIEQNQKHKYNNNEDGFMCDNWVEKVIDDAGLDSTKYLPAGNSYKFECIKHIEEAQKACSGFTTTLPTEDGAYVVYMGDGHEVLNTETGEYEPLREHAALLIVEDGGMTVWDNSSGNKVTIDGEVYNVDKTAVGILSSTQISKFGYDSFYYRPIF